MGIRRLILALLAAAAAGCADDAGVCDGTALEMRPPLAEPVAETVLSCLGHLVWLCDRPVVRLDQARCESPQVELAPAGRDDLFLALTLAVEDGAIAAVRATTNTGEVSYAVARGWLRLYQGSLADPDRLSGELAIETGDGAAVSGSFSALTNP